MKEWLKVKKIERKIEVRERRVRRSKHLLYFLKVTRVYREMEEETIGRSPWKALS
jgi:hypothetical protein